MASPTRASANSKAASMRMQPTKNGMRGARAMRRHNYRIGKQAAMLIRTDAFEHRLFQEIENLSLTSRYSSQCEAIKLQVWEQQCETERQRLLILALNLWLQATKDAPVCHRPPIYCDIWF